MMQRMPREALIWRQLDHPYILPLIGVWAMTPEHYYLISPWMSYGTLKEFMRSFNFWPYVDSSRLVSDELGFTTIFLQGTRQLIEVSEALVYLHAQKVVHGDLNDVSISPPSTTSLLHITIALLGKHLHRR
jgi:serine/threonine protein kinase